jgi:uncharacterized protein (UPF0264 family)
MTNNPPRLLVSVRDAAEAREALAGGADWIDLKEPRRGALGAVDAAVARAVVACIAGQAPISAAAGELADWPVSTARQLLNVPGISLLKLGLAGCESTNWRPSWRAAQAQIAAAGKQIVAVIYADAAAAAAPPPAEVLTLAADADCDWVLWDTFNKSTGPLDQHINAEALAAMLAEARTARQKTVVAGRLDEAAISRLPLGLIDMIAVRGAACRGSREAPVCRRCVAALCERLARHDDCCASSLRKTGNYFLAHGPCIACRFFRHAQDFLDTGFRCGILTGSACSRDNKGGGNCARALVGAAICSVVYLYHHARGDT